MKVFNSKTKRLLIILISVIIIIFISSFVYIPPGYEPPLTSKTRYHFSNDYNDVLDFQDAKNVADPIISEKIGPEFFSEYVEFDPIASRIVKYTEDYNYRTGESYEKEIYYELFYDIIIPETGIEEDLLHSVPQIEISIYDRDGVFEHDEKYGDTPIPDCHEIQRCFDMMDRDEAMSVLANDMRKHFTKTKTNYFVWRIHTEKWEMRYEPPVYKTPRCSVINGGSGGYVRIIYDSLNNEVTERSFDCHVGIWGI